MILNETSLCEPLCLEYICQWQKTPKIQQSQEKKRTAAVSEYVSYLHSLLTVFIFTSDYNFESNFVPVSFFSACA